MKLTSIFSKYPTYIFVGICVTVLTVFVRSAIGLVIADDTTAKYLSSIVLAYSVGIFLSLVGHKTFTFKSKQRLSVAETLKFIAVQLLGMCITLVASTQLRTLLLDAWLPIEFSKMLAFGFSCLGVSVITYILKKYVVFKSS